jgi:hypothetical protein
METYTLDTAIMGSKRLFNKVRLMMNIANKVSWLNPKKIAIYMLAGVYAILYAASSPLFIPINFVRKHWARGLAKANVTKMISK